MAVGFLGARRRGELITSAAEGSNSAGYGGEGMIGNDWSFDSTCTTNTQNSVDQTTCECNGEKLRYHCCNSTDTGNWDYTQTLNVFEYNYNYGDSCLSIHSILMFIRWQIRTMTERLQN